MAASDAGLAETKTPRRFPVEALVLQSGDLDLNVAASQEAFSKAAISLTFAPLRKPAISA